ncbi:BglG family transcription antiterminator [Companilactobacillus paralimentarius]|uniref:BglG family transcription antiterminator n=1 Tax=Companilactobacillus paralimentarius TaxID=83526 RepID=UPI00384E9389
MRTYLILKALIDSSDYVTMAFFTSKLNVSKRTIQNELSYLKKEGEDNGYELQNTYGKGYSLKVVDVRNLNHFLNKLNSNESTDIQGHLINDELCILLSTGKRKYTSTSKLSDELGISSTSLYSKVNTISEYLNSYHLRLERKSHYGLRIVGNPSNIRKLMMDLYMHGENRFKELVDEKVGNYDEYERLVQDSIRNNKLKIGYYEFQIIMCWLRVIVFYKLFFDYKNDNDSTITDVKSDLIDFSKFGDVLLKLQHNFQFLLNIGDVTEFYHLVEHSTQKDGIKSNINRKKLTSELLIFFKQIDRENHTDYSSDKFFLDNLVTHLEFLIARLDEKITYKNPLLLELCIKYSMIFDIVLKLSSFLKDRFGYETSNDELGLVAVHFLNHSEKERKNRINQYEKVAVICTNDGGISELVKTRFQSIFPKSEIRSFPFWDYSEVKSFHPKIIFSSVPLKENPDIPVIYIKELLSDKDLENIKRMLFLKDDSTSENKYSEHATQYLSLIKPDLFKITSADSYLNLINDMSKEMIKKGYAYKNFDKDVALRERYMSTVYKNGIAIPHPIEMDGKESAISLYIVNPKLVENSKDIKLVFMICLTKKDSSYYRSISNGLFQLMQNEVKINELYKKADLNITRSILRELGGIDYGF